ncbi:methionyl-tRNA formyltransferase [Robbsia sp. Bb-Pol-6]|uniref:Methionyl-tRNA formyltransferase n=1 Tax=Robbsia betulipollinis TaxID=2981849 RepID=A0ABT3ZLP0_9BURK|nr:methionyl-tRNA formyltransferase [Robbsia betulipollinis]MCY0386870.1 methionyl-tRNA formyltransferase [Robbsia betulipollinis]
MSHSLRVVFAGTPDFAAHALAAIHAAGFPVPLVLTQPDRPAGRGMKLTPGAVKRFALEHGLAVDQPPSLRLDGKYPEAAAAALARLRATPCDVMVVAAYGLLLPRTVLDLPAHGCLNIHASLLPRWRGAAPIHRAIEAGDAVSGVTLMQMDAGLDTGAMIATQSVPITSTTTTARLHDALAEVGARLIVAALERLETSGALAAEPQPDAGITYAEKIAKSEAAIDWRRDAAAIARQIRAFDPFPGALSQLDGATVKFWSAQADAGTRENGPLSGIVPGDPASGHPAAAPGTILSVGADAIAIACGTGVLRVTECQKPGGKRLPVREFLAGFALRPGQRFLPTPEA